VFHDDRLFSPTFQPYSIKNRESLFEDLDQQIEVFLVWITYSSHFRAVCCCSVGHDVIFIYLEKYCSRNNQ